MTRRQFDALNPGDRVRWIGADPEDGTVIANGLTVLIAFDRTGAHTFASWWHDQFELTPTYVEQVTR